MAYAIIENGIVTNIIEADADYAASIGAVLADGAGIGYLHGTGVFTAPPPEPVDIQALQANIIKATQARLDVFAATRNYDGILSACTYATSSVPKFAAEGQAAVNARDQTWASLYALMGEVQAGALPMPGSFADVEPLLPVLGWSA